MKLPVLEPEPNTNIICEKNTLTVVALARGSNSAETAAEIAKRCNAFEEGGLVSELLAILKKPIPESLLPEAWEKAKQIIEEAKEGAE